MLRLGLLIPALLIAGCAGAGGVRQNGRVVWERPAAAPLVEARFAPPPSWVTSPPKDGAFRYYVGEFQGDGSVDETLARAWASGMLRAGMVEFPSVSEVEASGEESLHGTRFERRFAVALGAVDWSDLDEARELGSPNVSVDEHSGQIRVFRLLRWRKSSIARARAKLAALQRTPMPTAVKPYDAQTSPRKLDPRKWLQEVSAGGRCRGDVDAAVKALGPPDRLAREPARPELRHYFWGAYRLTARLPERRLVGAVRVLGGDNESSLCTGSSILIAK